MRCSDSRFEIWNRKLHYYAGLYFLFFIWLFSLSGLIINHPGWTFASDFWEKRRQERFIKPLQPVTGATDPERARAVMAQVGAEGEIEWKGAGQTPTHLKFQAGRPGRFWEIDADLAGGSATVVRTTVNGWGAMRMLHTFTGVREGQPEMRRDWVLTSIWSFAMDAIAAGLAFMVLSGWWIWFRSGRRRLAGLLALAAGMAVCGFFLLA